MTEQERADAVKLAKAVTTLPVEKQMWVLGYAEGIADAKEAEHGGDPRKQDGTCQGQS